MKNIAQIVDQKWYYTIEVADGVYTKGHEHINLALTRQLLANIDVSGHSCLDIGTQEAVIPLLLSRRGAQVTAYDRFDLSGKIDFLKSAYNTDFDYIGGVELDNLPEALRNRQQALFDLVVFSGVMYHMINPMGHLILVAGLCKPGGLFVFESAALQHDENKLAFNAGAKLYGHASNYFLPTTAYLDYVMRMLGLRPLYGGYLGEAGHDKAIRAAIVCRKETAPCPLDPEDEWVHAEFHKRIFKNESQFDWEAMHAPLSQIDFSPYGGQFADLQNTDLYTALNGVHHLQYNENHMRLRLSDQT